MIKMGVARFDSYLLLVCQSSSSTANSAGMKPKSHYIHFELQVYGRPLRRADFFATFYGEEDVAFPKEKKSTTFCDLYTWKTIGTH